MRRQKNKVKSDTYYFTRDMNDPDIYMHIRRPDCKLGFYEPTDKLLFPGATTKNILCPVPLLAGEIASCQVQVTIIVHDAEGNIVDLKDRLFSSPQYVK